MFLVKKKKIKKNFLLILLISGLDYVNTAFLRMKSKKQTGCELGGS